MTSYETRLTVAIVDPTISEVISFNLSHKPRLKKVLYLTITASKSYKPPNRKLIYKDILDIIQDQNTERKLSLIRKE